MKQQCGGVTRREVIFFALLNMVYHINWLQNNYNKENKNVGFVKILNSEGFTNFQAPLQM